MATKRLRPGTWKLVNDQASPKQFRLDYELMDVPANGTLDIQVNRMASYDDSTFTAYRSAPSPQTQADNVGSILNTSGQSMSGEINPFISEPHKK
tara:strand:+ start:3018 stop:3302 length:285 start_codon:yes stop_codon:yes gene_type:complete